jgi:hypothetical protein
VGLDKCLGPSCVTFLESTENLAVLLDGIPHIVEAVKDEVPETKAEVVQAIQRLGQEFVVSRSV